MQKLIHNPNPVVRTCVDCVYPQERNERRPHFIRHHFISIYIIFLIAFQMLAGVIFNTPAISDPKMLNEIEERVLILVNDRRRSEGRHELERNALLERAAEAKAEDMIAKDYWSHTSPDGRNPWDFMGEQGYNFSAAGENLAKGFEHGDDAVKAWERSSPHLNNMLSNNFKETGLAVVPGRIGNEETLLYVHFFGTSVKDDAAERNNAARILSQTAGFFPNFSWANPLAQGKIPFTALGIIIIGFLGFDGYMLGRLGKLYHWKHKAAYSVSLLIAALFVAFMFSNFGQIL